MGLQSLIKRKQLLLNIFNAPDGQYGCDENVPNLLPGDSLEEALDKLACVLDKLAPPKPPNLSDGTLVMAPAGVNSTGSGITRDVSASWKFRGTGTTVPVQILGDDFGDIVWDPNHPSASPNIFYDADNGFLTFNVNQAESNLNTITQDGSALSGDYSTETGETIITGLVQAAGVTFTIANTASNDIGLTDFSDPDAFSKIEITNDLDFHFGDPGSEGFWYGFDAEGTLLKSVLLGAELPGTNAGSLPSSSKTGGAVLLPDHGPSAVSLGLAGSVLRGFGLSHSLNFNEIYHVKMEHNTTGIANITSGDSFIVEASGGADSTASPVFDIGAGRDDLILPGSQSAPFDFSITGASVKILNGVPSISGSMDFTVNYDAINLSKYFYQLNNVTLDMNPNNSSHDYVDMLNGVLTNTGSPTDTLDKTFSLDPVGNDDSDDFTVITGSTPFFNGALRFDGSGKDALNDSSADFSITPDTYFWDNDVESTERIFSDTIAGLTIVIPVGTTFKSSARDDSGGATPWTGFTSLVADGDREMQRTNGVYVFPDFDYTTVSKVTGPDYSSLTAGYRSLEFDLTLINPGALGVVNQATLSKKPLTGDYVFISWKTEGTSTYWYDMMRGPSSPAPGGWLNPDGATLIDGRFLSSVSTSVTGSFASIALHGTGKAYVRYIISTSTLAKEGYYTVPTLTIDG